MSICKSNIDTHKDYRVAFFLNTKKVNTGFTLAEVLVVILLLLASLALVLPVSIRFYQVQTVDDTALNLINALNRSKTYASFQKNDSSFGVKITAGEYVLFRGVDYASRAPADDEIFMVPAGVSVSGLQEIAFAKLSGLPSATGVMYVALGAVSRAIVVNENGVIE